MGRLYVGSCSGAFLALDADSGVVRWRRSVVEDGVSRQFHGDPLVLDSLVVIGADADADSGGCLLALDRADGAARWRMAAGRGVTSDVVALGGRGYAVTLDDELVCFQLGSGGKLWSFVTGGVNPGVRSLSPAVVDGRVLVAGLDWSVYALDPVTGRVLWTRGLPASPESGPFARAEGVLVAAADSAIHRIDVASGRLLGRHPTGLGRLHAPAVAAGDSLILLADETTLVAFDLARRAVRWRRVAPKRWSTARPLVWGDEVVVGTFEGDLFAFRLRDGAPRWSHRVEGAVRGIGAEGRRLYVGTFQGKVLALERARASADSR